jgi:DNA invertase Pin-like site-specific DNA recombinase
MLGVFAEFETNLRRERQIEGIADAKARGVYKGRKATIDPEKIKQMKTNGMGPSTIAKMLGLSSARHVIWIDAARLVGEAFFSRMPWGGASPHGSN